MVQVSISIDVPDLAEGEAFYCKALGCSKKRDQGNMCILTAGNTDIYLLKTEAGSKTSSASDAVRSFERHWTPVHLDFGVDDVDEAVSLIKSAGGTVEGQESGEWGAIAFCADPFGHGFCVIKE